MTFAGAAAAAVLLAGTALTPAIHTAAASAPAAATGEPSATGTMYDGNNTQAPKLRLQGPTAAAIQRMGAAQQAQPTGKGSNLGGNSSNARSGNNG